jgi:hypothetical protein
MSNQNNSLLRLPQQKKQDKIKPITPITIVNRNQIIKQNEILNINPNDLLSIDKTLVTYPNFQKRQHTSIT